jgi:hypothetical protein
MYKGGNFAPEQHTEQTADIAAFKFPRTRTRTVSQPMRPKVFPRAWTSLHEVSSILTTRATPNLVTADLTASM